MKVLCLISCSLLLTTVTWSQPKTAAEADSLVRCMRLKLKLNDAQYQEVNRTYRIVLDRMKSSGKKFSELDFEFEVGKVLIELLSAGQWQQWMLPEHDNGNLRQKGSDVIVSTSG